MIIIMFSPGGIKENFLTMMKGIYKKPTGNITFIVKNSGLSP